MDRGKQFVLIKLSNRRSVCWWLPKISYEIVDIFVQSYFTCLSLIYCSVYIVNNLRTWLCEIIELPFNNTVLLFLRSRTAFSCFTVSKRNPIIYSSITLYAFSFVSSEEIELFKSHGFLVFTIHCGAYLIHTIICLKWLLRHYVQCCQIAFTKDESGISKMYWIAQSLLAIWQTSLLKLCTRVH